MQTFVTSDILRDFLEQLGTTAQLDGHALVPILSQWLSAEPGRGEPFAKQANDGPGESLAGALADFWRREYLPPTASAKLKRAWNTFLVLEVPYFHPFLRGTRPPNGLSPTGALLCDRKHIAKIIADDDLDAAGRLLSGHEEFWRAIVPAGEIPSPQTVASRRDAALEKLTKELNRQLAAYAPEATASQVTEQSYRSTASNEPAWHELQGNLADFKGTAVTVQTLPTLLQAPNATIGANPASSKVIVNLIRWHFLETDQPSANELNADQLELAGARLDWPAQMAALELEAGDSDAMQWREDRVVLQAMIRHLRESSDRELRLQCATGLRQSSLLPAVEIAIAVPHLWNSRAVTALEAVAQVAIDPRLDEEARALARVVLLKDLFVTRLWDLGKAYIPLAHELTLALGKRPQFQADTQTWKLVVGEMQL